jgi:hypothetical protein
MRRNAYAQRRRSDFMKISVSGGSVATEPVPKKNRTTPHLERVYLLLPRTETSEGGVVVRFQRLGLGPEIA